MKPKKILLHRFIIIGISILTGIVIILFTSSNPDEAIRAFFLTPFSGNYFFGNMLAASIPLIFTGLAASVAFRAGLFNLGIEGQVYFGALIGTITALNLPEMARLPAFLITIISAASAGALLTAFSAFLKIRWGVTELISTLLIGYSMIHVTDFFLEDIFLDQDLGLIGTEKIKEAFLFEKILPPSSLSTAIFLAAVFIMVLYILQKKGKFGLKVRFYAENPKFSKYIGLNCNRIALLTMILSGALAGIAGIVDILGVQERMLRGFSSQYGWNGIAVALISKNNPLWIFPAAFLFAFLEAGATSGSIFADLSPEISRIIQGSIFFLVTAYGLAGFLKERGRNGNTLP